MNNSREQVREIAHISAIAGITGVQDIINSYAFYDKESKQFREKMAEKLLPITRVIKAADSRANRFGRVDDDDPHWIYNIDNENVNMQAVNCPICGEYQAYNSLYDYNIPHCNFDYEFHGLHPDAHNVQLNCADSQNNEQEEDYEF